MKIKQMSRIIFGNEAEKGELISTALSKLTTASWRVRRGRGWSAQQCGPVITQRGGIARHGNILQSVAGMP